MLLPVWRLFLVDLKSRQEKRGAFHIIHPWLCLTASFDQPKWRIIIERLSILSWCELTRELLPGQRWLGTCTRSWFSLTESFVWLGVLHFLLACWSLYIYAPHRKLLGGVYVGWYGSNRTNSQMSKRQVVHILDQKVLGREVLCKKSGIPC